MIGKTLAHYKIIEKIGAGGMGEVYRARDSRLDRDVAIKMLPSGFAQDAALIARFRREAKTISSLNHPHICTLYDVGEEKEGYFLVMELIEGESLAERLSSGALPLEQVLRFGAQIADALGAAHKQGITHRDLKPANVMLTESGAKLLDFGLAKESRGRGAVVGATQAVTQGEPITEAGTILGTFQYMSPEQLEGKEADFRSDIFALGAVLYEMITGHRAFSGSSKAGLISEIMVSEPRPVTELRPDASPMLGDLVRRCLAKDPDHRWQSARDVAGSLDWVSRSGVPTPGPPARETPRPLPTKSGTATDYRIVYFKSSDGASIAAGRGGSGRPLVVIPSIPDTIETSWSTYAAAFPDRDVITYDRRGTGLSERDSPPGEPEPYLQDAQAVVDGFDLQEFDILGTLLGTIEATSIASRNGHRAKRLVLRAPVTGLEEWASIPAVRAALATMEHDWEYFTESFSQLVVGWGDPKGRALAARIREITSRDELRALFEAYRKVDLVSVYPEIRAAAFVEHHPGYFFPDSYFRRIASLIENCRMAVYSGAAPDFMTDFSAARTFLATP